MQDYTMEYPPVLSKADFVRRYQKSEFGNRSPTWDTVLEFLLSGVGANPNKRFHLRNKVAGGETYYNVDWEFVNWFYRTNDESDYYVSEMAPHHHNLIQGEVALLPEITLRYSSAPDVPTREALAIGEKHQSGIIALLTLKYYLCPNSYDWLHVLLERYPGHVVEFSSFSCNWGTLPHYNTVFWEVRRY